MGWFDFTRSPTGSAVETLRVPLFPLNTVLFPGSVLPLKIFEQRYLDMAAACMKANAPFGVCLIEKGSEVGATAEPHAVGTLATIERQAMRAQLQGPTLCMVGEVVGLAMAQSGGVKAGEFHFESRVSL